MSERREKTKKEILEQWDMSGVEIAICHQRDIENIIHEFGRSNYNLACEIFKLRKNDV